MSAESDAKTRQHSNRRRRFIVDKPFQYRMIGTLVAIWLANSLFFSVILYFFFEGHLKYFYELVPRPEVGQPLLSLPGLFSITIGFILVFGMTVVCFVGVYFSNQIAGPLYRIKLCLAQVGKGDFDFEVRFRNRDFLRDVPGIFNAMLKGLKDFDIAEIEKLKELEGQLKDLPSEQKLVKELREQKEARVGIEPEKADSGREEEPVSVAVH